MAFSVNTNAAALSAIRTLSATNRQLEMVQAHINSGLKVASAKDDASTFAIAQGLRSDIAGFKAVSDAIAFGQATANIALNGAQSVSDTLNTIKQKIVAAQAANVDRVAIQNDIEALSRQVQDIVDAAQFNGVNLLNAGDDSLGLTVLSSLNRTDASSPPTPKYITVQGEDLTINTLGIAGLNVKGAGQTFTSGTTAFSAGTTISFTRVDDGGTVIANSTIAFEFVTTATSTLSDATNHAVVLGTTDQDTLANLIVAARQNGLSAAFNNVGGKVDFTSPLGNLAVSASAAAGSFSVLGSASNVQGALSSIESAITVVKGALARLGTSSTQLDLQANFVKTLQDSLTTGVGQLVDADMAEESANLQAVQTRQQLGVQALSIANQGPTAILGLFK